MLEIHKTPNTVRNAQSNLILINTLFGPYSKSYTETGIPVKMIITTPGGRTGGAKQSSDFRFTFNNHLL